MYLLALDNLRQLRFGERVGVGEIFLKQLPVAEGQMCVAKRTHSHQILVGVALRLGERGLGESEK